MIVTCDITQMTITLTLTAVLSFSFLWGACEVNSTRIGFVTAHSYRSPHHCPAEMIVGLVNHKKAAAGIAYFPMQWCTTTPYMASYVCLYMWA